ncbi:MAG: CPBP family intramembrane metalloprotease [Clostridia bacterium]|nr:CPBP family intramembrane metalloprotease [Clostridia bacterium]
MTKRNTIGFIYFAIVIATLLLRIASSLDVYSALGITDSDAFYSCIVQILIFGVMTVTLYMLTVGRREGLLSFKIDFGVRKVSPKNCLRVLVIAVCMIVVSMAISFVWQMVLRLMGFTHISSPTDYTDIGVLIRELALVALLPALFEELAHRGLIYAGYRECGWKFVLISALYFSLMHQNIVQTGYTFFAGVTMALAMYYTGSIFPGIFMHFLNNAVSVISGYASQNGGIFSFIVDIENFIYGSFLGLVAGFVLTVACAAIMVLMFLRMRKDAVKNEIISGVWFETNSSVVPLSKDVPFILTIVIGVLATLFSFVWGMMR